MTTQRKGTLNGSHFALVTEANDLAKATGFELAIAYGKKISITPSKGLPLMLIGKDDSMIVATVEDAIAWLSGWMWFNDALLSKTILNKDAIKDLIKQRKVFDRLANGENDQ